MKHRCLLLAPVALGLLSACPAPPAAPGRAGVDPEKLALLKPRLQEFVDRGEVAGLVAAVGRRGNLVFLEALGFRDLEARDPMRPDTIFRIASMTKPVVAVAILMLEDEGKLSVEDPVARFVPEFGRLQTPKPITLRHLLTHTSGIPGMPPKELGDLYARRDRTLAEAVPLFARPPAFEPGTKWAYCNTGIDVLGRVVEVASGKRFEDFLEERLFRPLGMKDTFFYPAPECAGRIARLYRKDADRLVPVEPFLGDAPQGKYPLPAGGLYSTAPDLARFYQMMLDRGAAPGRRLLSEGAVARMTAEQLGGMAAGFAPGMGMGLGWQVVREPQGVTAALSPGSYGHGGAFGTQGWIDPKREAYAILLVQRSNFPNADRSDLRRALQDGAAAAFLD